MWKNWRAFDTGGTPGPASALAVLVDADDPPAVQIVSPAPRASVPSGGAFEVVAKRSGKAVRVAEGQSIVDALATVGIKVAMSCEQGVCGTCLCNVLDGVPDHRDVFLTEEEKADNDQILLCCSRAKSDTLVLDI